MPGSPPGLSTGVRHLAMRLGAGSSAAPSAILIHASARSALSPSVTPFRMASAGRI